MPQLFNLRNLKEENLPELKLNLLAKFPNIRTKPDPNWVDPEDGSTAPIVPMFDSDWKWLRARTEEWLHEMSDRGAEIRAEKGIVKISLSEMFVDGE